MKKVLLFFSILIAVYSASAQKVWITDATVIKDSSGTVLTPAIWKALLATGQYGLKPEKAGDTEGAFRVYRLTEQEAKRRADNIPKPKESTYFTTGKKLAGFTAKDLAGNKYKLKDLEGKVVVLNFWFIGCGPCRMEIPELNKIAADYKDSSNVVFLAIALDAQWDVQKFIEKSPFNYNIISDGRYISAIYNVNLYPTHAVIDKKGVVTFHTSGYGAATIPWLRKSITQALL